MKYTSGANFAAGKGRTPKKGGRDWHKDGRRPRVGRMQVSYIAPREVIPNEHISGMNTCLNLEPEPTDVRRKRNKSHKEDICQIMGYPRLEEKTPRVNPNDL